MPSLITVNPTSAVAATATSEKNEENKGGYGSKHKLIHYGFYFNRNNDRKKSVQYNCINTFGKHLEQIHNKNKSGTDKFSILAEDAAASLLVSLDDAVD